jgi:hypothetical protein
MSARGSQPSKAEVIQLPRSAYEAILERLQDLEDALMLLKAERTHDPKTYLPGELVTRIVNGEHPVRVWRQHRGFTVAALARKSRVAGSYISEIETGKKTRLGRRTQETRHSARRRSRRARALAARRNRPSLPPRAKPACHCDAPKSARLFAIERHPKPSPPPRAERAG